MINDTGNRLSHTFISRRKFIKTGSLLATALPFAGSKSSAAVTELQYSHDFIPPGASLKMAFVADHHYWPDHFKNWGAKQFRHTEERMRDLVRRLNGEAPDVSIHAGDVIDAGTAFEPPYDEYITQLDYEKEFIDALQHPAIPLVGNHEVPDAHYEDKSELDDWNERFGPLHRYFDFRGWRFICLNTMISNPGGSKPVYGIDDPQLKWIDDVLKDATLKKLNVMIFAHIPPEEYFNQEAFERAISSRACVKGMMCGHKHRNYRYMLHDIPVMVRAGNVLSPMAYSILHLYPDGRFIVVQKSQHFPFLDYQSGLVTQGAQGDEEDRYFTVGSSSAMSPDGLVLHGGNAQVRIEDGHLTLTSEKGRGTVLIDKRGAGNFRLSFSATKEGATHMGAVFSMSDDGSERIDGVLTSEYGPDGNMYLAASSGTSRETLDRSWFNISDGIAYRFILEVRDGGITFSPENMPELTASIPENTSGKFGFFVENGKLLVTDLKLEKLL
jgi:hypothetical protein